METKQELLSDGYSVLLYENGSDVAIIVTRDGVDEAVFTPQAASELFDWLLRMATTIEKLRVQGGQTR